MRKHLLSFALISRIEGSCLRWLVAHGGSGLSCCALMLGALYGLSLGFDLEAFAFLPPLWNAAFWTLGEVAAALLGAAIGQFALLSLAAYSAFIRRGLSAVTVILAEIPSLCLLGLFSAVLPSFWSIACMAAFSLIARSLYATLKTGHDIPTEFLKTARALRLGYGQMFWRLHVPFAFPELVQSVLLNLPDFWLCLFGGEYLLAFCHPEWHPGLGGYAYTALVQHNIAAIWLVIIMSLGLMALVQHGLIAPLLGHGKRYAVCNLDNFKKVPPESRLMMKWRDYSVVSQMVILILSAGFLTYLMWPWPVDSLRFLGPLSYVLAAVCIIGLFWSYIGGLILGLPEPSQKLISYVGFVVSLFPIYVMFPYLENIIPTISLPALASLSIVGWNIAYKSKKEDIKRLFLMGEQLHLPSFPLWQKVRLPLLYPILFESIALALPFFWDNVYLVSFLGHNGALSSPTSTLYAMVYGQSYGQEMLFLALMTALALSVRWGVCMPLQERVTRRYGI